MKSWHIDRELEDVTGRDTWHETIRGADATCSLDARHLARVLTERPAYLASKPKLKYVAPGLRLVKPKKQNEDAA